MKDLGILAFLAAGAGLALLSSRKDDGGATPDNESDPAGPVQLKQKMIGGARSSDSVPIIILFHARGQADPDPSSYFPGVNQPARVVMPISPMRDEGKPVWFKGRAVDMLDAGKRAAYIAELENNSLWFSDLPNQIIAKYDPKNTQPVILTGYSQGGIMALLLSMETGLPAVSANGAAVALSNRIGRTTMLNGTDDKTVPFEFAKAFADAMKEAGNPITFRAVPGVGHSHAELPYSSAMNDMLTIAKQGNA